jgi:hypothetical protein
MSKNKDKFYESTSSDIKGEVVKFDLIGYTQTVGSTGEILICAQAKVDVLKHDLQRNNIGSLDLSGISDKYKKGDSNCKISFLKEIIKTSRTFLTQKIRGREIKSQKSIKKPLTHSY